MLSVLSAVALLLASPVTNHPISAKMATTPPVAPQAAGLAGTSGEAGQQASAIPGSLATAVMPRSRVATKPSSAGKTHGQQAPGTTTSTGTAAAGTGGHPAGNPVSTAPTSGGTVFAGNSQAHCIAPIFSGGVLDQSVINGISSSTGVNYNCITMFANPMPTWSDWETPWMFRVTNDGWDAWLAASQAHQMIMGMDLIPQSLQNVSNPLSWEQACANGDYNQYATTLAKNLVSYGAGNIVIRLGIEANGSWEADWVGQTSMEMTDWAQCYDNEVSAMRAVAGTHFTFVWNPNICTFNLPLSRWYPGNSYVDIIGADAYDKDCGTGKTVGQEGWQAYYTNSSSGQSSNPDFPSLANIVNFAKENGKPMSIPEWGLGNGTDDPAYVTDLMNLVKGGNFSFESYFDTGHFNIAQLGPQIPNATAAYAAVK